LVIWNPWHGCHKISPGCEHCYVYRRDASIGKDASIIRKTGDFDLPLKKNRQKQYKLQPSDGTVFTCMTSDFFLEEADAWRPECWQIMRERRDLQFAIITKRIHRFLQCIPEDWGEGYPNVSIYCTVENQQMADYRLPIYLTLPIRHKHICHEPMLGPIDIEPYLATGQIDYVLCGGESGPDARPCHYAWILSTREQCMKYGVAFHFKQTGAVFVKDGKVYHIERRFQQSQAAKANVDYAGSIAASGNAVPKITSGPEPESHEAWLKRDLFQRISESNFRSRFKLKPADQQYVRDKGMDTIRRHAEDIIAKRLAPAVIPNDGRQTPMRGHPVFLAQHACACCCRGCLEKWHGIPAGRALSKEEQKYVVDTLMEWIERQMFSSL
jgi:protein gp37